VCTSTEAPVGALFTARRNLAPYIMMHVHSGSAGGPGLRVVIHMTAHATAAATAAD